MNRANGAMSQYTDNGGSSTQTGGKVSKRATKKTDHDFDLVQIDEKMKHLVGDIHETVGPQNVNMFEQPSQYATQETHIMLSEEEEEEDEDSVDGGDVTTPQ
jgi:hypothetical protein